MKNKLPQVALIILTLAVPLAGRGDEIWNARSSNRVYLFNDLRARNVGDSVTIVIRENTDVDNRDERSLDKRSESSGSFDFNSSTAGDLGSSSASANASSSGRSNRKFDGSTEFSSAREFQDQVTVTIVDKLANGNLLVAGKRKILVQGDHRELRITGIVRPIDIRADNTVQSRFVSAFRMDWTADGAESKFSRQGWLSRIANRVWPF